MMPPKKPKCVQEWTIDETLRLIGFYQENDFLWNIKNDSYHKKPARDAKIDEFCDAFGKKFTADEIRSKWRNLQNYYLQEMKKEKSGKKTGSGRIHVYASRWKFFPSMEIIKNTLTAGESESTLSKEPSTPDEVENTLSDFDDDIQEERYSTVDSPAESTISASTTPKNQKPRKMFRKEGENMHNEFLKEALAVLKKREEPVAAKMESLNEAFGKQVALSLDHLPAYNQDWAELEIQQILFKAAHCLQGPSAPITSSIPAAGTSRPFQAQGYSLLTSQFEQRRFEEVPVQSTPTDGLIYSGCMGQSPY